MDMLDSSEKSLPGESPVYAAVTAPVVTWLRLEGLVVAVLAAVLYARSGASWWLFAALWLVPDLSMLGYLVGPRFGALCYNTVHSYLLPGSLAIAVLLLHENAALPFAYLWFNHIGFDRMMGYGLKYPSAFGATHLKLLGRPAR